MNWTEASDAIATPTHFDEYTQRTYPTDIPGMELDGLGQRVNLGVEHMLKHLQDDDAVSNHNLTVQEWGVVKEAHVLSR